MIKVEERKKGIAIWIVLLLAGIAFGTGAALGYFRGMQEGYGLGTRDIERFVKEGIDKRIAQLGAAAQSPGARAQPNNSVILK